MFGDGAGISLNVKVVQIPTVAYRSEIRDSLE